MRSDFIEIKPFYTRFAAGANGDDSTEHPLVAAARPHFETAAVRFQRADQAREGARKMTSRFSEKPTPPKRPWMPRTPPPTPRPISMTFDMLEDWNWYIRHPKKLASAIGSSDLGYVDLG